MNMKDYMKKINAILSDDTKFERIDKDPTPKNKTHLTINKLEYIDIFAHILMEKSFLGI